MLIFSFRIEVAVRVTSGIKTILIATSVVALHTKASSERSA